MIEKLKKDRDLLAKQLIWLQLSYDDCLKLSIKEEYTIDENTMQEFSSFETLCSRYSRGIDFLVRKMFRSIDEYEFENQGTLVDVVNNAHKRGLIEDIEQFRLMKDVRNTIVHEYVEEGLVAVFGEVLEFSTTLISIINRTITYIDTKC